MAPPKKNRPKRHKNPPRKRSKPSPDTDSTGGSWLTWSGRRFGYGETGETPSPEGKDPTARLWEVVYAVADATHEGGKARERAVGAEVGGVDSAGRGAGRGRLYLGDNATWSGPLMEDLGGKVDLIYMDPPYGTGIQRRVLRGGGRRPHAKSGEVGFYDHKATGAEFAQRLHEVFVTCRRLLSPKGQLFVHVDYRASGMVRVLLDEVFGVEALRNEIVWHYESGGRPKNFYARKSDSIFWYAPGAEVTFHPDRIAQPRNRCWRCGGELETWNHLKKQTDESGRVYRTIKSAGRVYRYYDDEPVPPSNVWMDVPIIHQRDPQRTGYPTQKPLALLERIVRAHTEEGDLVLDPFCGSGTTLVAAARLGRRWVGVDRNPLAVALSRRRLLEAGASPFSCFSLSRGPEQGEAWPPATVEHRGDSFIVRLESRELQRDLEHWAVGVRRRGETVVRCFWLAPPSRSEPKGEGRAELPSESPPFSEGLLGENGELELLLGCQKFDGTTRWHTIDPVAEEKRRRSEEES